MTFQKTRIENSKFGIFPVARITSLSYHGTNIQIADTSVSAELQRAEMAPI